MGEAKRRKQSDPTWGQREKVSWRIELADVNALDFAGDSILAIAYLSVGRHQWEGWVTYAADTIDGFSFSFEAPSKDMQAFLSAKAEVREEMGRYMEKLLADAGFSPQPRPNIQKTGDHTTDYKVSAVL